MSVRITNALYPFEAAVQFVGFFHRHDLVGIAVQDQHRTSNLARGSENIDLSKSSSNARLKRWPL